MMEAVSALPSALKTTSPERTWPTLRGHPPLLELGDRLEIPDAIDPPDGEISLTVPREYASVYQAAPLAFFLGATIRPGPSRCSRRRASSTRSRLPARSKTRSPTF